MCVWYVVDTCSRVCGLMLAVSLITLRLGLSLSPNLANLSSLASHLVPEIVSPPQMLWDYRQSPDTPVFM